MAPSRQPEPDPARPDPVRPVPVDPTGVNGPTRGEAAGPRWRRTSRGLYVPAGVPAHDARQRILEASMRLGEKGAVTGWASLFLQGGLGFDGLGPDGLTRLPVPLASPDRQLRSDPRHRILLDRLDPRERVVVDGMRCTVAERALFDDMRNADMREAVVSMDLAAHHELTSIRRMRRFLESKPRWRGRPHVNEALDLADERRRSANETRMHLIWRLDAGLPRALSNPPVFTLDGRLLGLPDLLDPYAGVVGEYDGADHRKRDRRFRDLGRETEFRRHGLEYFTLVAGDLWAPVGAVDRMRETRNRALAQEWTRVRRWTLRPPPGWVGFRDDVPLDDRLDLRDLMRHEPRS